MKCFIHVDAEAVGTCVSCGHAVCQVCLNKVQGKMYCDFCASKTTTSLPTPKDRKTAAYLAILLGGIGVHKFYLDKTVQGFLYVLFCWTFIPLIIGLIEGIIYLGITDEQFQEKYVGK